MTHKTRRDFIKQGLIGTAGATVGTLGMSAKSYAADSAAPTIASTSRSIGIRNQGTVHLNSWCALKDSHNVQVRTLCDTDERLFAPA